MITTLPLQERLFVEEARLLQALEETDEAVAGERRGRATTAKVPYFGADPHLRPKIRSPSPCHRNSPTRGQLLCTRVTRLLRAGVMRFMLRT